MSFGKKAYAMLAMALACAAPATACAWSAGGHAYIALHSARSAGSASPRELCLRMYGANAVDLFNTTFTREGRALAAVLHDRKSARANLAPLSRARTDDERAFALGFATHNEAWGTDATAHVAGVVAGRREGYVIAKAQLLAAEIGPAVEPLLAARGIRLEPAQLLEVCHQFVELAVDLLLVEADPEVGPWMVQSALCPTADVRRLLVESLGPVLAPVAGDRARAEALVVAAEADFRQSLFLNGLALMQPDAAHQLAVATGRLAEGYLGLPEGAGAALAPLIELGIGKARALCEPDALAEVRTTVDVVDARLAARRLGQPPNSLLAARARR
ncbi:hypothetical protein [Anaeromyxobacter oryzae]|nr:hypothetical protein [Anaeromyxobacter oryzae]